jgi:hypothetical protein
LVNSTTTQVVDHQQRGAAPLHLGADQRGQCAETAFLENAEGADVVDPIRHRRRVEELHPPQVREHARVRLGQHGDIQGAVAGRGMVEADVVGEDGLPGAGRALHDVDTALGQPALEDQVEAGDAGRRPGQVTMRLAHGAPGLSCCAWRRRGRMTTN